MNTRFIPIYINSFNQPTYLAKMVCQLEERGYQNLIIIDQHSSFKPMVELLASLSKRYAVLKLSENLGPHWIFTSGFALSFPEWFVYTDADIEFGSRLEPLFIDEMQDAARDLNALKVGMALDIANPAEMINVEISIGGNKYTIPEWESQFWKHRIVHTKHEIYSAPVDTTFAVYNRRNFEGFMKRFQHTKVFDCMSTPVAIVWQVHTLASICRG